MIQSARRKDGSLLGAVSMAPATASTSLLHGADDSCLGFDPDDGTFGCGFGELGESEQQVLGTSSNGATTEATETDSADSRGGGGFFSRRVSCRLNGFDSASECGSVDGRSCDGELSPRSVHVRINKRADLILYTPRTAMSERSDAASRSGSPALTAFPGRYRGDSGSGSGESTPVDSNSSVHSPGSDGTPVADDEGLGAGGGQGESPAAPPSIVDRLKRHAAGEAPISPSGTDAASGGSPGGSGGPSTVTGGTTTRSISMSGAPAGLKIGVRAAHAVAPPRDLQMRITAPGVPQRSVSSSATGDDDERSPAGTAPVGLSSLPRIRAAPPPGPTSGASAAVSMSSPAAPPPPLGLYGLQQPGATSAAGPPTGGLSISSSSKAPSGGGGLSKIGRAPQRMPVDDGDGSGDDDGDAQGIGRARRRRRRRAGNVDDQDGDSHYSSLFGSVDPRKAGAGMAWASRAAETAAASASPAGTLPGRGFAAVSAAADKLPLAISHLSLTSPSRSAAPTGRGRADSGRVGFRRSVEGISGHSGGGGGGATSRVGPSPSQISGLHRKHEDHDLSGNDADSNRGDRDEPLGRGSSDGDGGSREGPRALRSGSESSSGTRSLRIGGSGSGSSDSGDVVAAILNCDSGCPSSSNGYEDTEGAADTPRRRKLARLRRSHDDSPPGAPVAQ